MKLNSNLFITASLAATFTLMAACAPAKKGTNFRDRSGAKSGMTESERLFGKARDNSPEALKLRDEVISINAQIEEATEDDESKDLLEALEAKYKEAGMSGLEPVKAIEASAEAPGLSSDDESKSKNPRDKYVMSVHVNMAELGTLDFVGVAARFGDAKALQTLFLLNEGCQKKIKNLFVRAVCADKSCNKLLVQVAKKYPDTSAVALQEVLAKNPTASKAENEDEKMLKVTDFDSVDRSEELAEKKVKIVTEMVTCKDEAASAAATDKTAAADDKKAVDDKKADDSKTTDSKTTDSKTTDDKDKSADIDLSAMQDF